MNIDEITEVGIAEDGSLYVTPASARFPLIYREAMEVGWDVSARRLTTPKPREWSYVDWFRQIIRAARAQGVDLQLTRATKWTNVPCVLRREMEA